MLRARDWENVFWNVRRGRSVLFLGSEPSGSCEAATTGLALPTRILTSTDRRHRGKSA